MRVDDEIAGMPCYEAEYRNGEGPAYIFPETPTVRHVETICGCRFGTIYTAWPENANVCCTLKLTSQLARLSRHPQVEMGPQCLADFLPAFHTVAFHERCRKTCPPKCVRNRVVANYGGWMKKRGQFPNMSSWVSRNSACSSREVEVVPNLQSCRLYKGRHEGTSGIRKVQREAIPTS